jgi:hypothetical protein
VHVEFLLVTLESRSDVGGGEDVALNEIGAFGARVESLLELVGCALALELEGFGLEGSGGVARQ